MRNVWGWASFTILFIVLWAVKAEAGESADTAAQLTCGEARLIVYWLSFDEKGQDAWEQEALKFQGNFSASEEAFVVFDNLFREHSYCIPPHVRVLNARVEGGVLTLDVSGDILLYGGSAYEANLKAQILRNSYGIPGVNKVTLSIGGQYRPLPEGNEIR